MDVEFCSIKKKKNEKDTHIIRDKKEEMNCY